MTTKKIHEQLEAIAAADDFASSAAELTDAWTDANVGIESVAPILRFMEEHPTLDYGMPGPLVHFIEEFYTKGYEEKLIESVRRKPTMMTVWMLNRVLNAAEKPAKRQPLLLAMQDAANNRTVDQGTRDLILEFLADHA